MKIDDLKKELKRENKNFVPDMKSQVFAAVGYHPKQKPFHHFRYKNALAFGLVAIILLVVFIFNPTPVAANSYVIVDINPSIEIEVDKDDKVIAINPLNPDGALLLEDLGELKNTDLTIAIITIVNAAQASDYINIEDENSQVSITAINVNKKYENKLRSNLFNSVTKAFKESSIKSNLNMKNNNLEKLAKENNVSTGKMELINKAMSEEKTLSLKEACKMDINELNQIIKSSSSKLIENFNYAYEDKLNPLKQYRLQAIEALNSNKEVINDLIKDIEDLMDDNASLTIIKQKTITLLTYFPDYNDDYELKNYKEVKQLLKDLDEDLKNNYELLTEMINEKYEVQFESYKSKVKSDLKVNNHNFDFDFEFDNDFIFNNYQNNKDNSSSEKDIIKLVFKIKTLMNLKNKNNYYSNKTIEQIKDLYQDYQNLLNKDQVSETFKNSEFVTDFELVYQDFLKKSKKH